MYMNLMKLLHLQLIMYIICVMWSLGRMLYNLLMYCNMWMCLPKGKKKHNNNSNNNKRPIARFAICAPIMRSISIKFIGTVDVRCMTCIEIENNCKIAISGRCVRKFLSLLIFNQRSAMLNTHTIKLNDK